MNTLGKMKRVMFVRATGAMVLFAAAAIAPGQPQIAVPGMSKYSEASFGYSFWYPSHWKVTEEQVASPDDSGWFLGGTIVKVLSVADESRSRDFPFGLTIEEFSAASHSITELAAGSSPVAAVNQKHFFDGKTRTWMYATFGDTAEGVPLEQHPADLSDRTMGGLPVFPGAKRHGSESIVPLSADRFLVLTTNDVGGDRFQYVLAKTIVSLHRGATATLSTHEQVKAVHREGVLLEALASPFGLWYIDSRRVYDHQGNPIHGVNASTFRPMTRAGGGPGNDFATDGKHVITSDGAFVPGADPSTFEAIDMHNAKDARPTYSWSHGQWLVDGVPISK